MRSVIVFSILFIISCFCSPLAAGVPLDFVVMVDTSNSMEVYFDDLVQYIITDILKKNLRPGDTFHLIRFSELPVHEFTQVITDDESTDGILKEISFLKKKLLFGKYTDILAALDYLILYAEGLSKGHNKKLLLLSDFINNPSEMSPYAGITLEELEKELSSQAQTVRERDGWSIHFIRFPAKHTQDDDLLTMDPAKERTGAEDSTVVKGTPGTRDTSGDKDSPGIKGTPGSEDISSDREKDLEEDTTGKGETTGGKESPRETTEPDGTEQDVLDIISNTFDVDIPTYDENGEDDAAIKKSGFPRLEFPGYLGRQGRTFKVPFTIHNYLEDDIIIELNTLEYDGENLLTHQVEPRYVQAGTSKKLKVKMSVPEETPKGKVELPVTLTFRDDYRIAPREGTISFYYTGSFWVSFFQVIGENLSVIISVLIIVIILLIVFIFIRMRVFEGVFSDLFTTSEWSRGGTTAPEGELLIEMRVAFQNPHIGYRNIHRIDEDKTISVGGGFSTFLIFLIPMPSHIAEIENRDGTYIFHPLKMKFFPDLKGPVENCLNKEIPVVSEHGYRTQITFLEYESPLSRINKLLHSVQHEK